MKKDTKNEKKTEETESLIPRTEEVAKKASNILNTYKSTIQEQKQVTDEITIISEKQTIWKIFQYRIDTDKEKQNSLQENTCTLFRSLKNTKTKLYKKYNNLQEQREVQYNEFCTIYNAFLEIIDISITQHRNFEIVLELCQLLMTTYDILEKTTRADDKGKRLIHIKEQSQLHWCNEYEVLQKRKNNYISLLKICKEMKNSNTKQSKEFFKNLLTQLINEQGKLTIYRRNAIINKDDISSTITLDTYCNTHHNQTKMLSNDIKYSLNDIFSSLYPSNVSTINPMDYKMKMPFDSRLDNIPEVIGKDKSLSTDEIKIKDTVEISSTDATDTGINDSNNTMDINYTISNTKMDINDSTNKKEYRTVINTNPSNIINKNTIYMNSKNNDMLIPLEDIKLPKININKYEKENIIDEDIRSIEYQQELLQKVTRSIKNTKNTIIDDIREQNKQRKEYHAIMIGKETNRCQYCINTIYQIIQKPCSIQCNESQQQQEEINVLLNQYNDKLLLYNSKLYKTEKQSINICNDQHYWNFFYFFLFSKQNQQFYGKENIVKEQNIMEQRYIILNNKLDILLKDIQIQDKDIEYYINRERNQYNKKLLKEYQEEEKRIENVKYIKQYGSINTTIQFTNIEREEIYKNKQIYEYCKREQQNYPSNITTGILHIDNKQISQYQLDRIYNINKDRNFIRSKIIKGHMTVQLSVNNHLQICTTQQQNELQPQENIISPICYRCNIRAYSCDLCCITPVCSTCDKDLFNIELNYYICILCSKKKTKYCDKCCGLQYTKEYEKLLSEQWQRAPQQKCIFCKCKNNSIKKLNIIDKDIICQCIQCTTFALPIVSIQKDPITLREPTMIIHHASNLIVNIFDIVGVEWEEKPTEYIRPEGMKCYCCTTIDSTNDDTNDDTTVDTTINDNDINNSTVNTDTTNAVNNTTNIAVEIDNTSNIVKNTVDTNTVNKTLQNIDNTNDIFGTDKDIIEDANFCITPKCRERYYNEIYSDEQIKYDTTSNTSEQNERSISNIDNTKDDNITDTNDDINNNNNNEDNINIINRDITSNNNTNSNNTVHKNINDKLSREQEQNKISHRGRIMTPVYKKAILYIHYHPKYKNRWNNILQCKNPAYYDQSCQIEDGNKQTSNQKSQVTQNNIRENNTLKDQVSQADNIKDTQIQESYKQVKTVHSMQNSTEGSNFSVSDTEPLVQVFYSDTHTVRRIATRIREVQERRLHDIFSDLALLKDDDILSKNIINEKNFYVTKQDKVNIKTKLKSGENRSVSKVSLTNPQNQNRQGIGLRWQRSPPQLSPERASGSFFVSSMKELQYEQKHHQPSKLSSIESLMTNQTRTYSQSRGPEDEGDNYLDEQMAQEKKPILVDVINKEVYVNIQGESMYLNKNNQKQLQSQVPRTYRQNAWTQIYNLSNNIARQDVQYDSMESVQAWVQQQCDSNKNIFGGYTSMTNYKNIDTLYIDDPYSFVFKFTPLLVVYRSSGKNRYYTKLSKDTLSFGGGGGVALTVDAICLNGTSERCQTYNSPCLSTSKDFRIIGIELWGYI